MHLSQLSNVFVPNCKIYLSKFENAKPDRKPIRDQAAIRAAAKMGFSDKGFRTWNPAHFCRAKKAKKRLPCLEPNLQAAHNKLSKKS